ncbi:intron-associated endonuclease II [Synechococcus phage S-CREM2]|nr:intron-associated endonuclease II [Synechococcus phage S-CREM2]
MKELIDFSSLDEAFGLAPMEPVWVDWEECCEIIEGGTSGFQGYRHTEETKDKWRGANHWNWKGGISKDSPSNSPIDPKTGFRTNENYVRKVYLATSPEGEEFTITAMGAFCKEHNLSKPCMCRVANGERSHHKHWKVKML